MSDSAYKEDDRWIVNDLGEEGRNIGGWHYEEVNGMPHIKKRIPELFLTDEPLYKDDSVQITITNVRDIKGEASITSRKRKVSAFYEFEVKMDYEANDLTTGNVEKGEIHLPDISEENDLDEFVIRVKATEGDGFGKKAIQDKKRADKAIRDKVVDLLSKMRQGVGIKFNYGYATPADEKKPDVKKAEEKKPAPKPVSRPAHVREEEPTSTSSSSTTSISLKEEFVAPPGHIYDCFVDPRRIQVYTNSKAEVEARVGGKFSLLNGSIQGSFVELEHGKKIVQKWRFSDWPKNHYTTLTLRFENTDGKTILYLKQTNVPRSEEDKLKQGWYHQFFVRIKAVFHYGTITGMPF